MQASRGWETTVQDESLALSAPAEPRYEAKTIHYPDGGIETVIWEPDRWDPAAGSTVWDTAEQGPAPESVWDFPRRPRRKASEEDQERNRAESVRRARSQIRRIARARGYDRLVTFTTREESNTPDRLLYAWDLMRRRMKRDPKLRGFSYIGVPEPHPTNPDHWHLHLAVKGYKDANVLRRHWLAVLRSMGIAGGNVDIAYRVKRREYRPDQIARYLAKYIGKSMEDPRYDRKRYWASRAGAPLLVTRWTPAARDLNELRIEVLLDLGCVRHTMADFFSPARGVYWMEGWGDG